MDPPSDLHAAPDRIDSPARCSIGRSSNDQRFMRPLSHRIEPDAALYPPRSLANGRSTVARHNGAAHPGDLLIRITKENSALSGSSRGEVVNLQGSTWQSGAEGAIGDL